MEMTDSSEVLKEICPSVYNSLQEKDVVVWVDPLDGTSEFTEGESICKLIVACPIHNVLSVARM